MLFQFGSNINTSDILAPQWPIVTDAAVSLLHIEGGIRGGDVEPAE